MTSSFNKQRLQPPAQQVVRYVSQRYVDDFFRSGSLLLSSFRRCWSVEEARRDWAEGRFEGNIGTAAVAAFNGSPTYLLCTSTVDTPGEPGFLIAQPDEFAKAVAGHIPQFSGLRKGLCTYRDNKFDQRDVTLPAFDPDDPEHSAAIIEQAIARRMYDTFLVKDTRFAHEAEYRFLWHSRAPQRDFIVITCPEARQFCRARP